MRYTDKNRRPSAIRPLIANIPALLQDLKQWVLWRYVWKNDRGKGEWAKIPMQTNGTPAKSNDPATWSTFKDALSAWESAKSSFDGLGFMFTPESGIVGVDVDNCVSVDENGDLQLSKAASRVVELLDSYTELSPSSTGIHVIVKAEIGEALKDSKTGIEIYKQGRYFTVTGSIWSDFLPVEERTAPLSRIISGIKDAKEKERVRAVENEPNPVRTFALTADERLRKAFASQNGHSIARLFQGDTSDYNGDDSAADLALASKLAFWCEGDATTLDLMFRQSRLFRRKWDERHSQDGRTYGQMTIEKALAGCTEFYDPQRRQQPNETSKAAKPQPTPEEAYADRKARRFKMAELFERANAFRKEPAVQGAHPGWDNLNEFYRPRKGLFTVITGIPSHGKSSWLNALCYNLAKNHGWKFLFCSFETQPIEQHVCDMARIILGKPTFAGAEGACTDEEFQQACEIYGDYFEFAQVAEDDMTVDGVLAYAADAVRDDQIDGFIFDPWSELNPPTKLVGNYTQFVQQGLNKIRRFTRDHNIHTWLVAHPAKFLMRGQKRDVPTLYDVADSAHFYNKADFGVVVYRPDDETNISQVHVQKVRFYATGKKGVASFEYDPRTGRFEENYYTIGRRAVDEYAF